MDRSIMVVSSRVSDMDKAVASLLMVVCIKEIGKRDKLMDMERWYGLMAESIKACGQIITLMEMGNTCSLAELFIKENLKMILSMDLERIPGQTDKVFMAIGRKIYSMESVYSVIKIKQSPK